MVGAPDESAFLRWIPLLPLAASEPAIPPAVAVAVVRASPPPVRIPDPVPEEQVADREPGDTNIVKWGFDIHPVVFPVALVLIASFIALTIFGPAVGLDVSGAYTWLFNFIGDTFGWFYLLAVNVFILTLLYFAFSKYGNIKIGGVEAEKEFSDFSWMAMLFSAGMGIGQMQRIIGRGDPTLDAAVGANAHYAAAAVLPLRGDDVSIGLLALYAYDRDAFDDEEQSQMLSEVADNVAFGLNHSWHRRTHDRPSYHDPITGVGNRNFVENRLMLALNHAARRHAAVAVIVLDIDDFRGTNDMEGRATGDRVLQAVARILDGVIRPGDSIGRLGNDEFAIVFQDLRASDLASRVVGRVADCFPHRIQVEDIDVHLTVSLGVALYPEDAQDASELLSRAELALHSQSRAERSAITYYAPEFDRRASEQRALEAALRDADLDREFSLAWQPILDTDDQSVRASEVLLRWHHPELGEIPPARFIPLAEQTGRIHALGQWVLENACRQAHRSARAGHPVDVAVNVALQQLQDPGFADQVQQVLRRYGGGGWSLILELTETQFMTDPDPVIATCRRLRDMGCLIHIDDFGTGYSCLAYLHRMPLDLIKIDRAFVTDMLDNEAARELVTAIISMAGCLKLDVLAEGIEQHEQLEMIAAMGCRQFQGYLFGRPVDATGIEAVLDKGAEHVVARARPR